MTHVLLISHALIPSVRLCGYEQFALMQEQGLIEFRFSPCRDLTPELAGWADVIAFVRSDSKAELIAAKEWRKRGKYLIYVLDDDLLEIPDGLSSSDYYHRPNVRRNIRAIMKECHCFLSPSAYLRKKYGAGFSRVCRVEEPSLFLSAQPTQQNVQNAPVQIGFAGSIDRAGDLDNILGDVIRRLIQAYGERISVTFFGAQPDFAKELGLSHIPYRESYEEYQKTMQQLHWDIGLAPMPDSEFHRGKHYNKFTEYAACGIVGVYSDLLPYRGAVEHEISGMLCHNDSDSFYIAISRLIDEPALLTQMKKNVTELAATRFSLAQVTQDLQQELSDILHTETDRVPLDFSKQLRRIDLTERLAAGIRQDGFFVFCFKKAKKILKILLRR